MEKTALERLAAENEALRNRIAALEAQTAQHDARDGEKTSQLAKLERVLRELPLAVDIFDITSKRSVFKNKELGALLGYAPGQLEAMGPQPMLYKTVHPDDLPRVLAFLGRIQSDRGEMQEASIEYRARRVDGAIGWYRSLVRPFDREEDARLVTVLMVTYDITERKDAEAALRALNEELDRVVAERTVSLEEANQMLRVEVASRAELAAEAERRARLIRELSSPVLRVWDDVLAVPIIGALDAERAEIMTTSLLEAIGRTGVHFSILDLTGVGDMDAETAGHIERLLGAMTLLGVEVVICGIGPVVARVMVEEGLSMKGVTVRNLREALRHCIRRRANRVT